MNKLTHGRVTWLNIVDPSPDDIERLRELYPYIHPLHLEDVLSRTERPKIDDDQDYLFIVMHFPYWDATRQLTRSREVDFFVGRGYVITIHDGSLRPLRVLYERSQIDETQRQTLMGRGANHAFYTIIDQLVDYILPILRKVDKNIRDIEEEIFTSDTRKVIQGIALVRRDVIALRRVIRQQVPIVEQLERMNHPILHEDLEEYFGDISDHLYRERDIIDENYEIINSLADTVDTLATHRINEVMRVLTVFSVIMLPLTLLSGIYGMNFESVPLSQHPAGFFIIMFVMLVMVILMLIYFRRRNWL